MAIDPVLMRFAARGAGGACNARWSHREIERHRRPVVDEAVDAFMEGRPLALTEGEQQTADCLRRIAPTPQPPPPPNLFAEIARGFAGGSFQGGGTLEREVGHALSGFFLVGDLRDFAANARRREWSAAGIDLVGLVPIAGDAVKGAKRAEAARNVARVGGAELPASSVVNARLLREDIRARAVAAAFEAMRREPGIPLFRGAAINKVHDLVRVHGGAVDDWAKMTSRHTEIDGVAFQAHWFENVRTGQRVEMKLKVPGEEQR